MADSVDRLASERRRVRAGALHRVARRLPRQGGADRGPPQGRDGIGLTEAIMTIDLRHNVISGFEHGFRDIFPCPTCRASGACPWDPASPGAWATCARPTARRTPPTRATRSGARSTSSPRHGLTAIVAPELEFYLVDPDTYETYTPHLSSVYTCRQVSDPKGVFREIHRNARDLGLQPARRRAGVRLRPVRDQPRARRGARGRRPQPPVQDDGEADGRAPRPAGHVHGQAA